MFGGVWENRSQGEWSCPSVLVFIEPISSVPEEEIGEHHIIITQKKLSLQSLRKFTLVDSSIACSKLLSSLLLRNLTL